MPGRRGNKQRCGKPNNPLHAKLNERLQTLMPALEQAVVSLRESEQAWLNHWERQTVHLACAIAARIVRREIARTPEITLHLVREALELANGSSRLRLHLNPQDHAALADQVPAIVARAAAIGAGRDRAGSGDQPGWMPRDYRVRLHRPADRNATGTH